MSASTATFTSHPERIRGWRRSNFRTPRTPYHDWNERITEECYLPNACARIMDGQNRIVDIVNNYSRISFNFGPTLLSWMEKNAPDTYKAILQADKDSRHVYCGTWLCPRPGL